MLILMSTFLEEFCYISFYFIKIHENIILIGKNLMDDKSNFCIL